MSEDAQAVDTRTTFVEQLCRTTVLGDENMLCVMKRWQTFMLVDFLVRN